MTETPQDTKGRATTHVGFKVEDERDGQALGPVTVTEMAENPTAEDLLFGEPYDAAKPAAPWVTEDEARAIAAEHGVELEVS